MPPLSLKSLMLIAPRWTVAAAESLTCGHVQVLLGAESGASEFFLGGVTSYTLEEKIRLLGVDRAAAQEVDSVSAEIAEQMARGACEMFNSNWGIATTGYAEPAPERQVARPFAWWAVHFRDATRSKMWSGRVEIATVSRVDAQRRIAAAVVDEFLKLLRELRNLSQD